MSRGEFQLRMGLTPFALSGCALESSFNNAVSRALKLCVLVNE